ncbi:116_t:CDS:2 [Diversispora eburnea]|uniref:116_t:CDS:1 n=1 Tax=Diversispora eburnea TaxID=1213867 RepID=A0A9N8VXP1_9GLOM|nr:116_t:CDS:2 [Diversispora eburnea]
MDLPIAKIIVNSDFDFITSGEENNVITPDVDDYSNNSSTTPNITILTHTASTTQTNAPSTTPTSKITHTALPSTPSTQEITFETSNIDNTTSTASNLNDTSIATHHEEFRIKNEERRQYEDYLINQSSLNDRAYLANYFQYIPHSSFPQTTLSNGNHAPLNNGNNANNGNYVITLPTNSNNTTRIDPSLLNYERNMSNVSIPGAQSYGDQSSSPTNNTNQTIKKRKRSKTESDYANVLSLQSSTSTAADGIRQSEIAQCSNCGVHDTPAWRRDLQGVALLCNACGLYLKNKGIHRPTEIAPDGSVRLKRTRTEPEVACHRCNENNTPCWRGPEGQKLCNKCGIFLKQHGYPSEIISTQKSTISFTL